MIQMPQFLGDDILTGSSSSYSSFSMFPTVESVNILDDFVTQQHHDPQQQQHHHHHQQQQHHLDHLNHHHQQQHHVQHQDSDYNEKKDWIDCCLSNPDLHQADLITSSCMNVPEPQMQMPSPMSVDMSRPGFNNSDCEMFASFQDSGIYGSAENDPAYQHPAIELPPFPSPPRSRYASPAFNEEPPPPQVVPPPTYDQHMNTMTFGSNQTQMVTTDGLSSSDLSAILNHQPTIPDSNPVNSGLQFEPSGDISVISGGSPGQCSALTDTCPETPDSSVKEESLSGASSMESSLTCLWNHCNTNFPSLKALVDHINDSHMDSTKKGTEDRPCLWQDCNKKFNAKYKLVTHIRTHTKERPYICEFAGCTRSFARLENRKIHFRSHTGEKPFECKFAESDGCNKCFSNSSDRAKHEQTHIDPKPYRCEVEGCTKRYTDPSSLRKHVKNHTEQEQEQYRISKRMASKTKMNPGLKPGFQQLQQQQQWSPPMPMEESGGECGGGGGAIVKFEDVSSQSPNSSNILAHTERVSGSYHHLVRQPNSLDEIEALPADNTTTTSLQFNNGAFDLEHDDWPPSENVAI